MTAPELDDFLSRSLFNQRTSRVAEVTGTRAILTIPIGPEHSRPGGTVSGPMMNLSWCRTRR